MEDLIDWLRLNLDPKQFPMNYPPTYPSFESSSTSQAQAPA